MNTVNLAAKAVCLSLDFRTLGNSRKVSSDEIQTEADKAYLTVTKRLFRSDEYDAIKRRDSHTKAYLAARALPALFKRGVYLVPVGLVAEVEKRLKLIAAEREDLVEKFAAAYGDVIAAAEGKLLELFNARDYPTAKEVKSYFGMRWQYLTFDTPTTLKNVGAGMFEAEKKKAEAQWALCMEEARKVLRGAMAGLVTKLSDSLAKDEFGQDKTFRDAGVVKMRDFLNVFSARDISDDKELAALVKKAKDVCRGLRAEDVNSDLVVREKVRKEFGKLASDMEGMVIVKPKRAISFEEEE